MHAARRSRLALVAAGLALVLALAACVGDGSGDTGATGVTDGGSPSGNPVARPSSPAELTIEQPRNGAVVMDSAVDLRIELRGARIVPLTTTDISSDEGHIHVLLDDRVVSMTEGLEQSVTGVEPGLHRLTVEFVAADHLPFDPRVVDVVAFEARA